MRKPKPHRRLPKAKHVVQPWHPAGLSKAQLERHAAKLKYTRKVVNATELENDLLAFISSRYADRHLDVMTAQLALSNVAHKLIEAHLRAVA